MHQKTEDSTVAASLLVNRAHRWSDIFLLACVNRWDKYVVADGTAGQASASAAAAVLAHSLIFVAGAHSCRDFADGLGVQR